jgi:hypothetical protein
MYAVCTVCTLSSPSKFLNQPFIISFLYSEDRGNRILQNTHTYLPNYTVSRLIKPQPTNFFLHFRCVTCPAFHLILDLCLQSLLTNCSHNFRIISCTKIHYHTHFLNTISKRKPEPTESTRTIKLINNAIPQTMSMKLWIQIIDYIFVYTPYL